MAHRTNSAVVVEVAAVAVADELVDVGRAAHVEVGHAVGQQHDDLVRRFPALAAGALRLDVVAGGDQSGLGGGRGGRVADGLQRRASLHGVVVVPGQRLSDDRSAAGEPVEVNNRHPVALVEVRDARVALLDHLHGGDQRPPRRVHRLLAGGELERTAGRDFCMPRAIGAVLRNRRVPSF